MRPTPPAVIVATLIFSAFWILLALAILLFGRIGRLKDFRQRMLVQWKPSLAITLLFLTCMALGGRGVLNPYAVGLFCQALIGFALARSIPNFQPIPAIAAIRSHQHPWTAIGRTLMYGLVGASVAFVVGNLGLGICSSIFHETVDTGQAMSDLPMGKAQLLFLFLAGAGIAEETPFRLVALSLIWHLTGRRTSAILLAALLFGAYHLTPLSGMYQTFWQFPISQFVASALVGLVWGWAYTRAGYEAAVSGHTLSNWIPALIFLR
jgi:membrane protease YdiL (CAAX protease family)